jgi:hypothetical protein
MMWVFISVGLLVSGVFSLMIGRAIRRLQREPAPANPPRAGATEPLPDLDGPLVAAPSSTASAVAPR